MKTIICKDYDEMSKKAAEIITKQVKEKPDSVLGLATGSTPIGLYKCLIKEHKENGLDFSKVKTVNLDEYVGLGEKDDQSYIYFMRDNLFNHINIKKENTHVPESNKEDLKLDTEKYNKLLDDIGTRDIQVLGIGVNGHIAFNEPDDKLNLRTSIVDLTEETIEVNSRFFEKKEDVPTKAISMGLEDIFDAKCIILLANGKSKKEAIDKILNGKFVDTNFPASLLHLHPNVVLIVDEEAYNG